MSFIVVKTIGQGGFGRVDEVVMSSGERFALKSFCVNQGAAFPDQMIENARRRFIREARVQAGINHKHIVPVFRQFLDDTPPSFLMPLAHATLGDDLNLDRRLDGRFLEPLMDIISGLEVIHDMGIYHRDLKPHNVLRLAGHGEGRDYYAIGDFGLMSIHDTQLSVLTHTGMKKGSDFYTAPEIVRDFRKASVRSDVYSLGCILHDMVGNSERIPMQPIREDGPYGPLLLSCTREPARRFSTVTALRDALLAIDVDASGTNTDAGAEVIYLLECDDGLDEYQWRRISDFIDYSAEVHDRHLILRKLRIEKIQEVCLRFPEIGKIIGLSYAIWVREGSFDFSDCDGIANRLDAFIELGPVEVKAECLMAMLYMGTSHNRWYVERKFMRHCDESMSEPLAMRVAIELRADGTKACHAIRHLEYSINENRERLAQPIKRTLQEIC